jgi:hypothetical protein
MLIFEFYPNLLIKKMSRSLSIKGGQSLSGGAPRTKILLEQFNSCDPKTIKEDLQRFMSKIKVKDLSASWSNSHDTLVVKLNSAKDIVTAVDLAIAMKQVEADEIDAKKTTSGTYMRFWWD